MWEEKNNKLVRNFEFEDFKDAFSFMTAVAIIAEKEQHHPEWSNVWNKVNVELTTHDSGNVITDKDKKLAQLIDQVFKKYDD